MDAKHRAAFARRVDNMTIPWRVDMHKIRTRTARMNREKLLLWKEEMSYHEAHTKDPRERVYLVVSDLRLLALSENYSNAQGKWHSAHTELPTHSFLHERDINSLHESHWAVEINKHYYELVRLHGDRSKFSSDERVDENERQILARIFIGTSHLGRAALDAIGDAVIHTQRSYQLTRDNCHRFVKVFATMVLCPNHVAHTTSIPFDVEEHINTKHLNQRSGMSGSRVGKLEGEETTHADENYRYRVSHQIGEGVEWVLLFDGPCLELRRTLRLLTQRTRTESEPVPQYFWNKRQAPEYNYKTVYLNEFDVTQEQTSYFMRVDIETANGLYRCQHLESNPYLNLLRFEKVSYYAITQKNFKGPYKAMGLANGMVSYAYGVVWENGAPLYTEPLTRIRDTSGILRAENGDRLERPKSTWKSLVADIEDFFGRTSKSSFAYSLPTWDVAVLMAKQQAVKSTFPWVLTAAAGLPLLSWILSPPFFKQNSKKRRIERRIEPHTAKPHDSLVNYERAERDRRRPAGHQPNLDRGLG